MTDQTPSASMIVSKQTAYGKQVVLACDGICEKAWGSNSRPQVNFDEDDPDDFAWLSDGELGTAPVDPGTYEGDNAKPVDRVHNKWCFRECERLDWCELADFPIGIEIKRYDDWVYNIPGLHETRGDRRQFYDRQI